LDLTTEHSNQWLHRFAVFTAAATLFLIWVGGLVTSHGVGMSVPDWPTTYGYNMFFFPFSKWVGGIFYEHSHRLTASAVGLLTVILAVWLWLKEKRRWLRNLGAIAAASVCLQGLLGGLRVTQLKDEIGIFHAALAQLFFALVCAIALFTSRRWRESKLGVYDAASLRYVYLLATGMILLQLIIGASMRHQHAGLAIADFPLAYGKLWPATDAAAIDSYNSARVEVSAANPISASGVILQMVHRIVALLITVAVGVAAVKTWNRFGWDSGFTRGAVLWCGLILIQAVLGAATILTNKSADMATLHVAFGALSLVTGTTLVIWACRCFRASETVAAAPLVPVKREVTA
jgi:cytochrome c oxidase assembly protein subunit 15